MIYIASFLGLIVIGFFTGRLIKHKSLYPFMPFRYDFRKRRDTFLKVLELLASIKAKIIIETGTSREGLEGAKSQGAASIVFGKWAQQNNAIMHSVDISDESVRVAQIEVNKQNLQDTVKLHLSDSLAFLEKFIEPVDFLYLDSYDYSDDIKVQKKSQEHHLKEFKSIESRLHMNSVVLIDDCGLPGGGKGKAVIAYMQSQGWEILMEEYQVLLLHKNSTYFFI
jgi:predicted O-methyltransferase YrrM